MRPAAWVVALAALVATPGGGGAASPCSPVPVFGGGREVGSVCAERAADEGLTIVDLSSDWAPRAFAVDDPYRPVYVALSNERARTAGGRPVHGRYLSVYGVFPTPEVIARRLSDDERHRCHDGVEDSPLTHAAIQAHLRCDGLLPSEHDTGQLDRRTRRALHAYQRRSFLFARGRLDRATHDALETDSREIDFQHLLRTLRERVVDATGLIEDGSAASGPMPVLGRLLDPPVLHDGRAGLPGAAPDLVARATEETAAALGWWSPEAARDFLAARDVTQLRVAVRLPAPPAYHGPHIELRVQIDRGDVWYEFPYDDEGSRRLQPVEQQPTLVLYAKDAARWVPLVRWPTTIGGWRREVGSDGRVGLRYKESPVGVRYVRDLVVAPAWLPPSTTPDDELMRRTPDGRWVANPRVVGPGWASAFGLLMLVHHDLDGRQYEDEGIRTHGTASFGSVVGGTSHGCHRLLNHVAVRLGGFLLAHRRHVPIGAEATSYERTLRHEEFEDVLRVRTRGYRYELDPPLEVSVLRGSVRGARDEPPDELRSPPSP